MNENCCCCGNADEDERMENVSKIIEKFRDVKGGLIPVLHDVQQLYGYLPEEALRVISDELDIPMTEIYGVASFYHFFSLEPKGKHIIRVCLGTACYVKGGQTILNRLSQELEVEVGKTTLDGKFTLEATRCLGACGLSPVMTIDDKVYARVTLDDVRRILDEYTKMEG
ncbi:NADH-quinone oxidoreductase subunit NuoE [Clostridium thailandense]|uniref:NADH-quinone oxidoreductase subunit NuoE n=1 Tax=Clostridium thailandense TaxID=2794346 RepID=A0A949TI11_9CLOT|nr:NADH-quinone oxidoreductase subunit NuoE [Clostridium thailandense]MBV7273189.1 NADH-quinone oxidoreductase subunit NuoE [Clostridium thailandense]MCH5136046.1 NADH-quinone oxidoreductase subunit NuoE [Clostridiaceae bacterium UIB06]